MYVAVPAAVGVTTLVPEAATLPDQSPLAVHAEPLLEDQVSVASCPSTTVPGATEIVRVGGGGDILPPPP